MTIYTISKSYYGSPETYIQYYTNRNPLNGRYAEGNFIIKNRYGIPVISDLDIEERIITGVCNYLGINRWDISGYEHLNPATIAEQERQALELANAIKQQAIDEALKAAQQIQLMTGMINSPTTSWARGDLSLYEAKATVNAEITGYNQIVDTVNSMPSYDLPAISEIVDSEGNKVSSVDNNLGASGDTATGSGGFWSIGTVLLMIPVAFAGILMMSMFKRS